MQLRFLARAMLFLIDANRLWDSSGSEIKNQSDYVTLKDSQRNHTGPLQLFITVGEEKYRPINGAFLYLLTQGKAGLVDWMVQSLSSIERNYHSKFGPYPVIVMYNVDQATIDLILSQSKFSSRIYWVPVHHLFDPALPELPVFENETIRPDLTYCADQNWQFPYVQMIRFRAVSILEP